MKPTPCPDATMDGERLIWFFFPPPSWNERYRYSTPDEIHIYACEEAELGLIVWIRCEAQWLYNTNSTRVIARAMLEGLGERVAP